MALSCCALSINLRNTLCDSLCCIATGLQQPTLPSCCCWWWCCGACCLPGGWGGMRRGVGVNVWVGWLFGLVVELAHCCVVIVAYHLTGIAAAASRMYHLCTQTGSSCRSCAAVSRLVRMQGTSRGRSIHVTNAAWGLEGVASFGSGAG